MGSGPATPEQAILDELAAPLGTWEPLGDPSPGGWQAGSYRGGRGDVVDLATVRFVKERATARRRVYYVAYEAVMPRLGPRTLSCQHVYEVSAAPDGGWRTRGVSGGAGDGPRRSTPWVNLGGGGWPDRFVAGGPVDGAGVAVARVQLPFANGVTLDDDSDGGVVLFVCDEHVEVPVMAVLFDDGGEQVATHEAIPAL